MSKNPDVKVQVTGGGSGIGLAALQNKSTDLANSSRKMKPAEIANCVKVFGGRRPTEYKVASTVSPCMCTRTIPSPS